MAEFTDYQRKMWTWLSYVSVCSHEVVRDKKGNFVIKRSGWIRTILYFAIWTNTAVKVVYLFLTYQGWLLEVHFLDQMSICDWFLCFFELLQESSMWYPKYPLYEIFAANWRLQEEIYSKLGSPQDIKKKILKNDKILVHVHTSIVTVSCLALVIQFLSSPKYALNTYAILPWDRWPLRILFAVHEFLYMWHIWAHAASSVVIGQVFAVTYTHLLTRMGRVMRDLSRLGEVLTPVPELPKSTISTGSPSRQNPRRRFLPDRILDPETVAHGTRYDTLTLLHDYRKVMMAASNFNGWVGGWVGGITGTLYLQFVSDVFMMIQLLKEPDVDFMGVLFFFVDAFLGMFMMFRMLILMSRVVPASEGFLQEFKNYCQNQVGNRRYLLKYEKTLRKVAAKLGGHSTNPQTVPKGIHVLMNYYIAAALWERPKDRLT